MRALLVTLALAALAPITACTDDRGAEEELPGDGKDDSFQRPTDHGPIAFGVGAISALTATERHHTWTFEVWGTSRVDLTTSYAVRGQRRTDTVLYLYKKTATGWGAYIARNDDYNETGYSQLIRDLGPGQYRVLVKGYLASTMGKFKVTVGCTGAGCVAPPTDCLFGATYGDLASVPELTVTNENVITTANLGTLGAADQARLVTAVQQSAHTDVTTAVQALGRVDGGMVNVTWLAEPAARRSFIAFEYGAGDNSYGAIFDRRSGELVTRIQDGDLTACAVAAESCLLPEDYAALRNDPAGYTLQGSRVITAEAQLDSLEHAQVLAAIERAFGAGTSVAAGLAMVDDGQLDLRSYTRNGTNTDLTIVAFGAGDTSLGSIYYGSSLQVAGVIDDLFIDGCSLFAPRHDDLAAGAACRATSDCATGLACRGIFAGGGVCATIANPANEGNECTSDAACGSPDLVCAGVTRGYGLCRPSWMRGSFTTATSAAIPDAGVLVRRIVVRGLATVDTDVALRMTVDHPRASQLRITLSNPATAELVVHDGTAADDGRPLVIDRALLGFSGDESVNGEWTLRVWDRTGGQVGTLGPSTLTVTSRWD